MDIPKEFLEMVNGDIERLSSASQLTWQEKIGLHREIDGRYQSCIQNWYIGFAKTYSKGVNYGLLGDTGGERYVDHNLKLMKSKLETYRFGMNAVQLPDVPSTNVTVNTSVNVSVTFEQVRERIEDMPSLTNEQTQEILNKINEIENVVNSSDKKKTKWEKIKPVLVWLADKSCDVGTALLPLLLKI